MRLVIGSIGVLVGVAMVALGWLGARDPRRLLRADLAGEYHGYRRFQLWEMRVGGVLLVLVGASLAVAAWFVPLPAEL